MRVFLDTNVLVSAFTTRGLCADLFRLVLAEHDLLISETVLEELGRTLTKRFNLPQKTASDILAFLSEFPVIPKPTELPKISIRDPDDLPILAAASNAHAYVLITGDRDLLCLGESARIRIVDPREFWNFLRGARD